MRKLVTELELPLGVQVIASVFVLKNDCSNRLLNDRRLDAAWPWLWRLSAYHDHFSTNLPYYFRSYGRLSNVQLSEFTFGDPLIELGLPLELKQKIVGIDGECSPFEYNIHDYSLNVFDHLSAAIYCELVNEFQQNPPHGTQAELKKWAKECFDAADLCDVHKGADITIRHDSEIQTALAIVSEYLREKGEERLMKRNDRIIKRSSGLRGDDRLRGTAQRVTNLVQRYFGPFPGDFPHAAVARFLIVGWGLDLDPEPFTKKVSEWCKDFSKPNVPAVFAPSPE